MSSSFINIEYRENIDYPAAMSEQVILRFYAELNDFLLPAQRKTAIVHALKQRRSIKDLIESIGVPHPEVDLIIANNESVGFDHIVSDGEYISIYPAFTDIDISPLKRCQPAPVDPPRFVLDNHLGRLAAYLRMLGFDTLYRNDYNDALLAEIAEHEQRILLSCDRQLLMRSQVTHGCFVRSRNSRQQLLEVAMRYSLNRHKKPFTRCMECNGEIHSVSKLEIENQLPADAKKYYSKFYRCDSCGKIYWEGSHYLKMKAMIASINDDTMAI